ncbi:MAG: ATP-binding protein [Eggerthellaceae bacterium]|nr:ATP-binding protein [Eggerthellaceae bacterium]
MGGNVIGLSSLKPKGYHPRIVDGQVEELLGDFGGVEICGPRWCGKSWTSLAHGSSITRVDVNGALFADDPSLALAGAPPHIIDEWQDVPAIWNLVRHAIDDRGSEPGQFLLTGSSSPMESKGDSARHSGAGRIARLRMSTMTLLELGVSSGLVSLGGLFRREFEPCSSQLGLADVAELSCTGGWPALVGRQGASGARIAGQYLDALFEETMPKARKSPQLARRIAASLARNVATSAKLRTIAQDAGAGEDAAPAAETVSSYLQEFERNYFIEELPGWDAPVRAKSRLRTKPKRYLADPSLVAALLGVGPAKLLEDAQLFGLVFESLAVHDLAVLARCLPGYTRESLRYYSDADGLEVDVIIELADGRWAAIEVPLGESTVAEAEASLMRLKAKVAANPAARNADPAFMAVLLAKGAFARQLSESGVYVIPIDTLGA